MRYERLWVHAIKMVRRNLKSYAMLCVTIVLSLVLLLGYLLYSDSETYNSFKELNSSPEQVVTAYTYSEHIPSLQPLIELVRQADPDCYAYPFPTVTVQPVQKPDYLIEAALLPEGEALVYAENILEKHFLLYNEAVRVIEGKTFPLHKNEAIMSRQAYAALFADAPLPQDLHVSISLADGSRRGITLQIVGLSEEPAHNPSAADASQEQTVPLEAHTLYASITAFGNASEFALHKKSAFFYSQKPRQVIQIASSFGQAVTSDYARLIIHATVEAKDRANAICIDRARTKYLLAIAMMLVLSVNLFASYANALNSRRFEIGVKRAIGAMGIQIVRQFLMEGQVVSLLCVIVSVYLTTVIAIVYQYCQMTYGAEKWIVTLSPYSMAAFAVCSCSLTVTFSLWFSQRATRVGIRENLDLA